MDEKPKKRAWFQLHLSMCVVLMEWQRFWFGSKYRVMSMRSQGTFVLGGPLRVKGGIYTTFRFLLEFLHWTVLSASPF